MYGKTLSDLGNILLPTRIYTLDLASICDSSLNQPLYDECKTVIFQLHHFLHVSQLAFCLKEKSSFSPFFVHIYLIISIYSWTPFFFQWITINCYSYFFCCSDFSSFGQQELLQAGTCIILTGPHHFLVTTSLLSGRNVPSYLVLPLFQSWNHSFLTEALVHFLFLPNL